MLRNMRIQDTALNQFIQICREEFGEEISRSEASEMAFRLVTLYQALSRRLASDAYLQLAVDPPRQKFGFQV